MKVLRGTPKHLSKTGKLNEFTYLMLNLPFQCNYHCLKCFNINPEKNKSIQYQIKFKDRVRLIHEAKDLGAKVIVFAGEGEPLLSEELNKLLTEVKNLGMISIVYSNGSTLSPDKIDFLIKNNSVLVISFDSLNPKKYDLLTGTKNQFNQTFENIKDAIKKYRKLEYSENGLRVLSVALNTTISSINELEIEKIKIFFGDDVYFICNPLANLGNAIKNWKNLMEPDRENSELHKEIINKLSESGGPLTLGADGLCGYSIAGISVSPNGDYMTCAYTDKTDGLFGNIKNKNLRDAFEFKRKKETDQYQKYGIVSCLVRSKFFTGYIKELKNCEC